MVDYAKFADQRHIGETVGKIVVIAMVGRILVNETALFQLKTAVVVVSPWVCIPRTVAELYAPVSAFVIVQ